MIDKEKIAIAIEVQEAEKAKLLQRIAFIDEQIENYKQQLKKDNPKQTSFPDQILQNRNRYDKKDAWVDKVLFFINQEKRFLHSREIQEFILTKEPNQEPKELQRRVSGALARLKRENAVINYKVGRTNLSYVWGASHWLDANGQIKKGYEYKPEYIDDKKSKRRIID